MLEQLFGSKTRAKLLQLFFQSPERSFYVRELARLANVQLNAIRRELANLEGVGIVAPIASTDTINNTDTVGTARSKYYRLNAASLLFYELKSLLTKAQVLEQQELVESLRNRAGKIKLLLLSGNFTGVSEAETDLLLVGEIRPVVVAKLIDEFEKKMGNPIRYTIMNETEFGERNEIGDKFLYSIFEGKHVAIIDELTRL